MAMSRGVINFTGRTFVNEAKDYQPSNEFAANFRIEEDNSLKSFEFKLNVAGNLNHYYKQSNLIDLNEAYISYEYSNLIVTAGYQLFNWSDLESFHPADIVNSRIIDSDVEAIKKRGELALSFSYLSEIGILKLYFMPKVIKNYFPDSRSRVADGSRPVSAAIVKKSSVSSDFNQAQYGIGFENTYDDLELKFNLLKAVNRSFVTLGYDTWVNSPGVRLVPTSDLTAYYSDSFNLTFSGTYFYDVHTLKFEYIFSSAYNKDLALLTAQGIVRNIDRSVAALGYEYQFNHSNGSDSMVFLEYQFALKGSKRAKEELYVFQNDLFIGHRLMLNDAYASEVFSGVFFDPSRSELLYLINFSKRFNNNWKYKIGYRGYKVDKADGLGLNVLKNDDEVYLTFSRFF